MGLFDIIKNLSIYGENQPITRYHSELQELLDNGSFVVDLVDQIDDMLKLRRSTDPKPDGYLNEASIWIGFWDESPRLGHNDFYEKFYQLFYDYLEWDCSDVKKARLAKDFMEQCLVPILSDYYQQIGQGCVIMVRNGKERGFTGGIFLVWTYPEF